ncbi:MAG TPA: hypothetical protein VIY48_10225 [Candidatus Paceibacterota bacterium]
MKNKYLELVLAVVLVVLAVVLANPFGWWMPSMLVMLLLALAVVVGSVWGVFVMRERAADERDEAHRALAGRVAFLTGGAVLLVGIVIEELAHALDPWLVGALVAMIVAKYAARVWSEKRL